MAVFFDSSMTCGVDEVPFLYVEKAWVSPLSSQIWVSTKVVIGGYDGG
ncbi:unnamed protein product [Arabidopsis halleri]